LFTISHFGSANITTQTPICQVRSPRRSPRFLNNVEQPKFSQNSDCTIIQYFTSAQYSSSFTLVHKLRFWWFPIINIPVYVAAIHFSKQPFLFSDAAKLYLQGRLATYLIQADYLSLIKDGNEE
jgi:hypothetical protein